MSACPIGVPSLCRRAAPPTIHERAPPPQTPSPPQCARAWRAMLRSRLAWFVTVRRAIKRRWVDRGLHPRKFRPLHRRQHRQGSSIWRPYETAWSARGIFEARRSKSQIVAIPDGGTTAKHPPRAFGSIEGREDREPPPPHHFARAAAPTWWVISSTSSPANRDRDSHAARVCWRGPAKLVEDPSPPLPLSATAPTQTRAARPRRDGPDFGRGAPVGGSHETPNVIRA